MNRTHHVGLAKNDRPVSRKPIDTLCGVLGLT
jgi:hypothetical protein